MKSECDRVLSDFLKVVLDEEEEVSFVEYRNYHDLIRCELFLTHGQKKQLIHQASASECSSVIFEVLLYVNSTMSKSHFHQLLKGDRKLLDHWTTYLRQQQNINSSTMLAESALIQLYYDTDKYDELAIEIMAILFPPSEQLERPSIEQLKSQLQLVKDADALLSRCFSTSSTTAEELIPSWVLSHLQDYMLLLESQLQTEQEDVALAPKVMQLEAYVDKHARGKTGVKANWRKRYFTLTATELNYAKYDRDTMSKSANPFLDKREKGSIQLTSDLLVQRYQHRGTTKNRPYCILIEDGDYESFRKGKDKLIFDVFSLSNQEKWLHALISNIKRLSLDPLWLKFPRSSVCGMTVSEFIRYCMLYHQPLKDSSASHNSCKFLQDAFQVDPKRILYDTLVTLAMKENWSDLEQYTKPGKVKQVFSSKPQSIIGFGPFVDISEQMCAPPQILKLYRDLLKSESKSGWECRYDKDIDADYIPVEVPENIKMTMKQT